MTVLELIGRLKKLMEANGNVEVQVCHLDRDKYIPRWSPVTGVHTTITPDKTERCITIRDRDCEFFYSSSKPTRPKLTEEQFEAFLRGFDQADQELSSNSKTTHPEQ